MPDLALFLTAGVAVLFGAAVQSSVGLGVGLVAAPVISLLDPTLMPGAMITIAAVLPMFTIGAEWRSIDWRGISWAMAGRVVGTFAGVWVVASVPPKALAAGVGAMVLIAVGLTLWAVRLRTTPGILGAAGVISGVTGTATSIGGPPLALVYQRESGAKVRASLGVFFIFGALLSLAALALGGQLDLRQVGTGLVLVPFVVGGFLLSRPLRRVMDGKTLRAALLIVVSISGVVLLLQAL